MNLSVPSFASHEHSFPKFTWYCTDCCNDLSKTSDRSYIPIPNSCHSDYCPPERTRDRNKHAIWLIHFCIVAQGRKQQDPHREEKTCHTNLLPNTLERHSKGLETNWISKMRVSLGCLLNWMYLSRIYLYLTNLKILRSLRILKTRDISIFHAWCSSNVKVELLTTNSDIK